MGVIVSFIANQTDIAFTIRSVFPKKALSLHVLRKPISDVCRAFLLIIFIVKQNFESSFDFQGRLYEKQLKLKIES